MPQTMDCYVAEFSTKERLAIYDSTVARGKATNKPINMKVEDLVFDLQNSNNQDGDKPKTQLELMAEQRDYKRRRQSYKAKKVHLTKKSYTEVIREVIENHSNFLSEMCHEESDRESRNRSCERNMREDGVSDEDRRKTHEKDYCDDSDHHRSRKTRDRGSYDRHRSKHKKYRSRSRSPSESHHRHKKHKKHKKNKH